MKNEDFDRVNEQQELLGKRFLPIRETAQQERCVSLTAA